MSDMLSQAEIDALLGGGSNAAADPVPDMPAVSYVDSNNLLSNEDKDILGEIGNISMGTAATTLFALLGQKVWITTPKVNILSWSQIATGYNRPCVGVKVAYTEGLQGSNILILKQKDVKIISNLMMGGDGTVDVDGELNELDLSAIGEAMNQMVGSSSTSLSSMIKKKIDIDTPHAFVLDFNNDDFFEEAGFAKDEIVASISFRMEIGNLIDSDIMQVLPIEFASSMVQNLKSELFAPAPAAPEPKAPAAPPPMPQPQYQAPPQQAPQYQTPPQQASMPLYPDQYQQMPQYQVPPQQTPMPPYPDQYYQMPQYQAPPQQMPQYQAPPQYQMPQGYYAMPPQEIPQYYQQQQQPQPQPQHQQNVNVQPAQFQNFDMSSVVQQKENIDIIMDVPLEVTVELGRTTKKIKDILSFSIGTIVELDRLAGEPIDIMVNGKFVAKGEVVVIDENFGIRITDIISVDKRI